jgi:ubiquinone/menaquinone biosynthesis C-methylase UbiE
MISAVGGPMARGLLRAVPPTASPLLELASGTGFFSAQLLAALGPSGWLVGCDAGRAVLEVAAAKRLPGLYLLEADAHALPLRRGSFNAAYCNLGMHIFLQPQRVVQEMADAVRAGGGIAYSIPARGTLIEFWQTFAERVGRPDLHPLVSSDGWKTIAHWTGTDDQAERELHLARLAAAGLQEPRAEILEERLEFPSAADLLTRGGFGHFNFAVETLTDDSRRPAVLAEVSRLFDTGRPLTVTIRALIASGRVAG